MPKEQVNHEVGGELTGRNGAEEIVYCLMPQAYGMKLVYLAASLGTVLGPVLTYRSSLRGMITGLAEKGSTPNGIVLSCVSS